MRTLKDDSSLIKKWEFTGLLKYVQNPEMMSFCLEHAVKTLHNSGINEHNGMILPLILRVMNKINPKFRRECRITIQDIITRFPIFMSNNYNVIDDLMSITGVDWEAEMCRLFVEEYLKIYENNKSIR